jgi:hypothetical protein
VTDDECGDALRYLAETDFRVSRLLADMKLAEAMKDSAKSAGGLYSEEKSADKRKMDGETSPYYLDQLKAWHAAMDSYGGVANARDLARIKIEVWRTIQANKRLMEAPLPGRR